MSFFLFFPLCVSKLTGYIQPKQYKEKIGKDNSVAAIREQRKRNQVCPTTRLKSETVLNPCIHMQAYASGDPEQIKAYEADQKAKQEHKNELQQRRRHDRNPNGRHYRPRGSGRKPRPGRDRPVSTISTGSETGSTPAFTESDGGKCSKSLRDHPSLSAVDSIDYVPYDTSHATISFPPQPFHPPQPDLNSFHCECRNPVVMRSQLTAICD